MEICECSFLDPRCIGRRMGFLIFILWVSDKLPLAPGNWNFTIWKPTLMSNNVAGLSLSAEDLCGWAEEAFHFLGRPTATLRGLHTFNFRGGKGLLKALCGMQKKWFLKDFIAALIWGPIKASAHCLAWKKNAGNRIEICSSGSWAFSPPPNPGLVCVLIQEELQVVFF